MSSSHSPSLDLTKMKEARRRGKARFRATMIAAFALLIVLAVTFLCVGEYPLNPIEALSVIFNSLFPAASSDGANASNGVSAMQENVVLGLRLPRIFAAILVGAALAISGAAFQGIFKNPLVSPDFLGVSAGACVGAGIAILLSLGSVFMQLFAFVGGIIAVVLTTTIPKLLRSNSNIMLVLSGIIVGGLMSSIFGLLKYLADPETQLPSIIYWQMGSFSYVEALPLLMVLPIIIIPAIVLLGLSWRINLLSLGEREAKSLGVNVGRVRGVALVCATLATAGSICIAGTIGWVGLVIPHFARMLVGPSNTRLLPASILLGGLFMLIVDTAARTVGPLEMPISILTGIIGTPFYAWLLYKQRRSLL